MEGRKANYGGRERANWRGERKYRKSFSVVLHQRRNEIMAFTKKNKWPRRSVGTGDIKVDLRKGKRRDSESLGAMRGK